MFCYVPPYKLVCSSGGFYTCLFSDQDGVGEFEEEGAGFVFFRFRQDHLIIGSINQVKRSEGWLESPSEKAVNVKPVYGAVVLVKTRTHRSRVKL